MQPSREIDRCISRIGRTPAVMSAPAHHNGAGISKDLGCYARLLCKRHSTDACVIVASGWMGMGMLKRSIALFVGLICVSIAGVSMSTLPASAQAIPKSLENPGPEADLRERKNMWTVGLAGGLFEGTFMRFAEEIRKVVDDGDEMRVLPIVTPGVMTNLEDLLYLHGVDVAVTQADVFEFFRTVRKTPNLDTRINYILRFPVAEVQIVARDDVHSIEDLRGKKVHFAALGSASTITGPIVFQRLGVDVQQVVGEIPGAVEKLRTGEFAAIVRVVQKPVGHIASIPANAGLHFLAVPYSRIFTDYYAPAELTHADYPNLVAEGEKVETIAVPSVLAVFNWQKKSDRYRRVARFVQLLFANFDKLQRPPFHPRWRDVNLAATVPGWTRWSVAQAELQRIQGNASTDQAAVAHDFQAFLAQTGTPAPLGQGERDELFRRFLQWQKEHGRVQ